MSSAITSFSTQHGITSGWLKPYIPFIGALVFVTTLSTTAIVFGDSMTFSGQFMGLFMGFFYIVFAVPKLMDLQGFAHSFARYDVIAHRSKTYARIYPTIEAALGVSLLATIFIRNDAASFAAYVLVLLITVFGFIGINRALRQRRQLEYVCLGTSYSFPLSTVAFVENITMLLMSVAMLGMIAAAHLPSHAPARVVTQPSMHMSGM